MKLTDERLKSLLRIGVQIFYKREQRRKSKIIWSDSGQNMLQTARKTYTYNRLEKSIREQNIHFTIQKETGTIEDSVDSKGNALDTSCTSILFLACFSYVFSIHL